MRFHISMPLRNGRYNCNYSEFFLQLAEVDKYMMKSRIFAPHRRYYVREMRIQAYTQLLESYA